MPPDWDNNDAEAYAILRYLQSVEERSAAPERERVLVLSDSRAVLDVLEDVWRSGDANLAMARDRGAMLEAICAVRKRLERVVFLWVPGHRGVAPNEMADVAAGAHLGEQAAGDITRRVARDVQTRDASAFLSAAPIMASGM